jgi:hypothetical protein
MFEVLPRPELAVRLAVLAANERWRLVYDVLLDVVHSFGALVAPWSALLLTTEESLRALKDLAEQAEELSLVFVELDGNRPASDDVDQALQRVFHLLSAFVLALGRHRDRRVRGQQRPAARAWSSNAAGCREYRFNAPRLSPA